MGNQWEESISEIRTRASLENFSESQRRVIEEKAPVIRVIAAAGSGKTRTVVGLVKTALYENRVREGRILLLSFSRKAVGEMKERLGAPYLQHVNVSTFHSFCFQMIRDFHPGYAGKTLSVLDETERDRFFIDYLKKNHSGQTGGIPYHLLIQQRAKAAQLFPELIDLMNRALEEYKANHNLVEYDELISILLEGMGTGQEWTFPVGRLFDLVIVDEFQDTDPGQFEFLKLLSPPGLVVVGDDWQAIYGFRGATVEPFLGFHQSFRQTVTFYLAENYRSRKEIVDAGSRVVRSIRKKFRKKVKAIRGKGGAGTILSHGLKPGSESLFNFLKKDDPGWIILVRTNDRLRRWIRAGIPEDRVLTIHKSKGLEFPVVLLDLSEGWGYGNTGGKTSDEELRILYVGITRAMDRLILLRRTIEDDGFEVRIWQDSFSGLYPDVSLNALENLFTIEGNGDRTGDHPSKNVAFP